MTHRFIFSAAALLLAASSGLPSLAQDATAPAKPAKTFMVLSDKQIDPAKLLAPPPADRSVTQAGELDRLRQIQTSRTAERLRQAQDDENHEDPAAFAQVLGPKFDIDHLPATRAVFDIVQNDASVAASMAKTAFHRHRPWIFDPTLTGCTRGKNPDPLTSYPSGHAVFGYAEAVVLANLVPNRKEAIMSRAYDYGYSRLVCEVHYPTDVAAGAVLGIDVGALLIDAPAMQDKLKAARAELKTAGVD